MQSSLFYFSCFLNPFFNLFKNKQRIAPSDPRFEEVVVRAFSYNEGRLITQMHNTVSGLHPHINQKDADPVIGRKNSQSFNTKRDLTPTNEFSGSFFNKNKTLQPMEESTLASLIEGNIDPDTGNGNGLIKRFQGTVDEILEEGDFQDFKLHGSGKRIEIGLQTEIKGEIRFPTEEGDFEKGVLKNGKQTAVDGTYAEGIFEVDPEDEFLILTEGTIAYPNGAREQGNFKYTVLRNGINICPGKQYLENGIFNNKKFLINGIKYQKKEKKYEEGLFIAYKMERGKMVPYVNKEKISSTTPFEDGALYAGIRIQNDLIFIIEKGEIQKSYSVTDEEKAKLALCENLFEIA